jgi:uncharacterized protein
MPRAPVSLVMFCAATACAASLLWTASVFADAATGEIEAAITAGRLDLAQLKVNPVLRDRPSNAHAHYLQAEIFAHEGSPGAARVELSRAETLTPGLPDEDPRNVVQLRRAIAPPAALPASTAPELHFPLGLALAAVALWWLLRRRT